MSSNAVNTSRNKLRDNAFLFPTTLSLLSPHITIPSSSPVSLSTIKSCFDVSTGVDENLVKTLGKDRNVRDNIIYNLDTESRHLHSK